MAKIKIYTPNNVKQYGLTASEINGLNSQWEARAAELGLEEHQPEYWQAAKRHMSEKLAGRDPLHAAADDELRAEEELAALPSLDFDLDDFNLAADSGLAPADELVDAAAVLEEIPELESIDMEALGLEEAAEEEIIAADEIVLEEITGLEQLDQDQAGSEESLEAPEFLVDEMVVQEFQIAGVEEKPLDVSGIEEETVEPLSRAGEAIRGEVAEPEAGGKPVAEAVTESEAEEEPRLVAETGLGEKVEEESLFAGILRGLRKMFRIHGNK
ncbi:MAG: hypothetical protein HY885_04200 [Deltaproteobacteria bacterium]|nr:hypothetical protein [Deltaproteobacteria bacterium]